MRKQMRLGNNLPGQIQAQRESAKRGTQATFSPVFLFLPLYAWRWRQEFRCCVISERSYGSGKIARLIYNLQSTKKSYVKP